MPVARRLSAVLLGILLVSACGASTSTGGPPPASAGVAPTVSAPVPSATATPVRSGDVAGPGLSAVALPAGIAPVSISAARLLYGTNAGPAGILDLATGAQTAFPDPPGGLRFAPVRLAGTIAAGDALNTAADGTVTTQSAIAFDLATGRYLDIGAALGHPTISYVLGSDEATVVGMASDGKAAAPTRAYLYDVATGRVTIMPGLPDGYAQPQPLGVSGRYVVGNDGTGSPAGGFVYDIVTGRYTMLWRLLGSHAVEALGVDGSVVVGDVDMSPFVYDLGSGRSSVHPIPMPGFKGSAVDGARVLLAPAAYSAYGWVFRTDTMTGIPLDAVRDPASPTGTSWVVPVAISGHWILGYVPATLATSVRPARMVLVMIPPAL